ncbi:DUF4175 family protein [Flagellimonas eckloniae]|uniref:Glutamyl-tRNA synthetase n=1 Tax=Flagellimonas eckloniae TaxID=346185 RepID=A0A0Q1DNM2_9FLAO|nr:DUF4175 family protein [Allomuricauda eckloniae]KQC30626.1 hypothetical protein AAY42_12630 [Allomuricauda eckloniae]
MNSYYKILSKLNEFTKKYYTKQLIKGILLFLAIGLLFLLGVMSLEYVLWLNQDWRLVLFLVFILVELFLLYKFILVPLFFLFRVRKGISNKEASLLIGRHFPLIDDKLYNLLELAENKSTSELLMASIEQRSEDLSQVSFAKAIDFKESFKYAKYVVIPILILGFIWLSGNIASFFNSYKRVVNYDLAYEQPAPFAFQLLNQKLEVLDNEPLTVRVITTGDVKPENVFMVMNGEELLLKNLDGVYTHTFEPPVSESNFYLMANGWNSKSYSIRSFRTPSLLDFEMRLNYPKYTQRTSEVIKGTGNAVIPEGTQVAWNIKGKFVDAIEIAANDTLIAFDKENNVFAYRERVYNDLRYELSTSNENVKDYEKLGYQLEVIKDAYPSIEAEQVLDSINQNQSFYTGQTADDYKVSKIRAVCYPADDNQDIQRVLLQSPNNNVHQFYYTFPSGFTLEKGRNYKLYFEVVDNDGLRSGKVTKSKTFNTSLFDDNQLKNKELEFQNSILNKMDKSLEKYKEQQETLSKINDKQKEEKTLNFDDKNEIKDFLKKQEQQEELMEKFSQQLKESLNKEDSSDERKKMLQERLERQELEAKKNEKLLEELNKLADKIDKEELKKKLDELGKKQSSSARNLEQILELTKRYYVTEKMAQLSKELEELSKEQEELSEKENDISNEEKEQQKLNEDFEKLAKELDELKKDNENLKKPMSLNVQEKDKEGVKEDQQMALEELNKSKEEQEKSEGEKSKSAKSKAEQKQKSAAQKMKEMSKSLQQSSMGGGGSSITEDAEMLRQILDNLVTFSFKQEKLLENIESADVDISQFSRTVRDQKELRRLFEHVDDSLFALSLRRAELSEFVNEQITEVYYNIDKSLESIAENQIFQGASYQQYVVNATNALADILANILDNMQQNMKPGQGSGQGGADFQLPDIIKGQQGVQEKMGKSGQQGKNSEGEEGENGDGKPGEGEKEGSGKDGEKGSQGKDGEGEGKEGGQGENGGENGEGGQGGDGEMGLSEIYEIYKEQQYIRQQLEKQLKDLINEADRNLAKKMIRQMEDFENDLLENGITQRTRNKVNTIQHELLKLENATLKQGKKKERESNTNLNRFTNPITTKPELLREYQNDIEILNRQALPLRQNYEKKVKVYFKND